MEHDFLSERQEQLRYGRWKECFVPNVFVRKAAIATARGVEALLTNLSRNEQMTYADLAYPVSRTTEIRRLARELLRRGRKEDARRIIRINHLLKQRLHALADRHGLDVRCLGVEGSEP